MNPELLPPEKLMTAGRSIRYSITTPPSNVEEVEERRDKKALLSQKSLIA
jgi:hypothetical protein